MNKSTIVLLPVRVPKGDMCWNFKDVICEHFDNQGGYPTCLLGHRLTDYHYPRKTNLGGVLKPLSCKELKEAPDAREA